ncbi:cytochrome C biogenesis protein CcdA [Cereibacter changlensis JA139]|uniref:Cytochrome C biogenesis protein CcdA n=2 Tax=Cereibacter changlensis TaxID=402884 RepID=A0A2T4JWN8_9RHOB|nr:cytochrome c biogenesis protein CcdA [Cereibacter changlensis]PTE22330.1 cytochrome C biogenesis protein CcdA [Cereibacter changlensis JA139]PZX55026.1 cytochrome c-type biogenesis protein [Cereibacter changlensis]
MLEMTYGGAALAGLLSFLSPCILPMVPFYLSYMAGLSVRELRDGGEIAPGAQARLVRQSLLFALGVTTIFVLLGMGATALGRVFVQWREVLSWVAGGVLILFGLHFLGVLRIGLFYREARVQTQSKPTTLVGAYVMGLAFGFGWTPCVGPALAAILMVASGMGEVWRGGALLLVYGLAMTLPFVIAALFAGPFLGWIARHRAMMGHVEKVMGVMLIVFGLLIATNSVNLIADWMIRNFDWSATLN